MTATTASATTRWTRDHLAGDEITWLPSRHCWTDGRCADRPSFGSVQESQVLGDHHPGRHRVFDQSGPPIDGELTDPAAQSADAASVEFVADVVQLAVEPGLLPAESGR